MKYTKDDINFSEISPRSFENFCYDLLVKYNFYRQHIISIMSGGGSTLNFVVQGMNEEAINDFVYRVSLAKQERLKLLHNI